MNGHCDISVVAGGSQIRIMAGMAGMAGSAVAGLTFNGIVGLLRVEQGAVDYLAPVYRDNCQPYRTNDRHIGAGRSVTLNSGDVVSVRPNVGQPFEWLVQYSRR